MNAPLTEPTWWQRLPDALATRRPAVLVTVARALGSTPRNAGASMLVELDRTTDTLGGGNLELEAINAARRLLDGDAAGSMIPYTLGPGLRQCCGGSVWLLYERFGAESPGEPPGADGEPGGHWRSLHAALLRGERVLRRWDAREGRSSWRVLHASERPDTVLSEAPGLRWQQVVGDGDFNLRLFGAGHVGRALARLLVTTAARLQWIDPRPEQAEAAALLGLPLRLAADPLEAVHDAQPGSWFIVMTHSHALDFELVEAILRRRDARFCGLIGSATKAARFRHNLREQGLDASMIAGLTCPLGIAGIDDKAPASIAVSITAQLLQLVERDCAERATGVPIAQLRLARRQDV